MQRLQGKVAVVAGGATGIGAGTALRLAAEGAQVVVGDLHLDAASCLSLGKGQYSLQCDCPWTRHH